MTRRELKSPEAARAPSLRPLAWLLALWLLLAIALGGRAWEFPGDGRFLREALQED